MSWKKANAAGAKQQAHRAAAVPPKSTNVKKTLGGRCQNCGGAATVQHGNVKLCRGCASDYE